MSSMKESESPVVEQGRVRAGASGLERGTPACAGDRVRVAGKLFVRGSRQLRIQGVAYGPFAPNSEGECYPDSERVAQDFTAMRGAGINALRVYHPPPT